MVHELTKTKHDGLTVGDRVYLASDGKQRAGLRYGTLVDIHRDTPRGHFWYRVEWDGGQHHKARAVLTRQEIVKLVDTRAPKPSRPTVAELQAEVAELREQLAEANEQKATLNHNWLTKWDAVCAERDKAQATIERIRKLWADPAMNWLNFSATLNVILSAPSSTGGN
jgi:hypothetical protein